MLAYTGGHPYDTMQVAYDAFLLGHEAATPITRALAAAACGEAQLSLAPVLEAELDALGPKARLVLTRLARREPVYRDESSASAVQSTLRALVSQGVLRRHGRGRYAFVEPMLARHVGGL